MNQNRRGVFVAVICTIAAGCSGEASGGTDIIHVNEPGCYVWHRFAVVAAFLYLPIAALLAGRAADIRVAAALPLIGGTALASFTLLTGLEFVSEVGANFGRGLVAALLAESILPWSISAAVSAVTSLAIGVVSKKTGTIPGGTPSGSIALVLSAAVTLCTTGLMLYVWTAVGRGASQPASGASILFVISLVALSIAAVSAFLVQRSMARRVCSRWLWLFAVCSAAAAGLGFLVAQKLSAVAEAGG